MEKLSFNMGSELTPSQAMSFALEIAGNGVGFVEPNPPVGCVILNNKNQLIGFGHHEIYGGPHAEVNAINSINDKSELDGAHVFVTLEPCGHVGKTPACTDLLLKYNLSSVTYAQADPNPLFSGAGLEKLKKKNIKVIQNDFDFINKIKFLTDKFISNISSQEKSYITLKMATSLDGFMGLKSGESKWLSNEKSRNYTHRMRNGHDAILVGVNTVLNDNPRLNVRLSSSRTNNPKVIILDPNFRSKEFLLNSNLINSHKSSDIYIATNEPTGEFNRVPIEQLNGQKVNLKKLRLDLFNLKLKSVFVEGGACTISEFIVQNEFNCIKNFITPNIIGSISGISWSNGLEVSRMKEKLVMENSTILSFDDDILFTGFLSNNSPEIV